MPDIKITPNDLKKEFKKLNDIVEKLESCHNKPDVNCWDFIKCNKEDRENCPAFTQSTSNKCWLVAGTLCGSEAKGMMAKKVHNCKKCDFYSYIKERSK